MRKPAGVSSAIGEPGKGLDGWRLTHRQAQAAMRIALRRPQRLTRYADVALLAVADWYEMFPDLRISFEDITDAGPGRVIAISHIAGTALASAVPTELRFAVVWTIRDGKIVRGREYCTMDGRGVASCGPFRVGVQAPVFDVRPRSAKARLWSM